MPKAFLIDTSRCTACRGCQLACKEWHELPANATRQMGSHQNPPDLNPNNYKLVRFSEHMDEKGVVRWNFFPDQCRHCLQPPCKDIADTVVDGAIIQDKATGAVIFTEKTRKLSAADARSVREACPYDIPRRNDGTGLMSKCTMCHGRVKKGMLPACVKVCPTGAMNFGERDEILALAKSRLADAKREFPKAMLADAADVSVIFLLIDEPKNYHEFSVAGAEGVMGRKQFLAGLASPLRKMAETL
ncbi:MAG: 4Fe-4S dicluster domain-containing protein [Desulfovibrionaceae bacterium]